MKGNLAAAAIGRIVDFDPDADRLYQLDFTAENRELSADVLGSTALFSDWVAQKLSGSGSRYGIGGYNEHRTIYARSGHFDGETEPRRLHLGVDVWGPAGTPVYNFYDARVHSFRFNDNFGDYGATIVLGYTIEDITFHALYGHLNLSALAGLEEGMFIPGGVQIATFGNTQENGHWPPHLHFQLINDMQGWKGDYPGVCQYSKRAEYLQNCPDPAMILKHTFTRS